MECGKRKYASEEETIKTLSRKDPRFLSPHAIRAAGDEECILLRTDKIQRFYIDTLSGEKHKKALFNCVMQDTQ